MGGKGEEGKGGELREMDLIKERSEGRKRKLRKGKELKKRETEMKEREGEKWGHKRGNGRREVKEVR